MSKIKDLLDNWLKNKQIKEALKHTQPEDNTYYASSAGSCPRKMYYSRRYPQENDLELLKVFEMGNIVHEFIQDVIMKGGQHEVPIKLEDNGIIVRGRLDCLYENELYELKSTKSIHFVKDKPNNHHVMQLMLYMKQLGYKSGNLLYIEKNTLQMVEHTVEYDDSIYNLAIALFRKAHQGLSTNTLPVKECEAWECKFCNYQDKCQKEVK